MSHCAVDSFKHFSYCFLKCLVLLVYRVLHCAFMLGNVRLAVFAPHVSFSGPRTYPWFPKNAKAAVRRGRPSILFLVLVLVVAES